MVGLVFEYSLQTSAGRQVGSWELDGPGVHYVGLVFNGFHWVATLTTYCRYFKYDVYNPWLRQQVGICRVVAYLSCMSMCVLYTTICVDHLLARSFGFKKAKRHACQWLMALYSLRVSLNEDRDSNINSDVNHKNPSIQLRTVLLLSQTLQWDVQIRLPSTNSEMIPLLATNKYDDSNGFTRRDSWSDI